jgi:hypothetical protein
LSTFADVTQAPPGTATLFDGVPAGPDAVTILYPYANTVMPVGLKAPEIHWQSATAADAVKVSLRFPATGTPTFEWSTIIPESSPPRATLDQAAWEGFDRSARGQDAALVLQRVVGGTLRDEVIRTVHFAPASLRGQIYYTEYGRGASSPAPSPAVGGTCAFPSGAGVIRSLDPSGTTLAADPFGGNGGCPVCHSVSANGTTFVTSDWGNANGVSRINADGTFTPVATSPQPPSPGVDSRGFSYAAITPDGQYVLQGSNLWGNTNPGGTGAGQRLSGGNGTGLRGEYWSNTTLAATPLARQIDEKVQFSWAAGAPYPFLGADAFSVRWQGKVQPYASETFTFSVVADGGVRLWVDGTQLIDQWSEQVATHTGTIDLTAGTKYDIVLEYFESSGAATAELRWSSPTTVDEVIPQTQLYPAPLGATTNGLTAEYFDDIDLTGTLVTRVDPNIDFDWGGGSPMASMGADTFSVRWTGSIQPLYTETYTFHASTDDGVRVWVNGTQIVDNWVDQGSPGACPAGAPFAGSIALTGGAMYPIRVEFRENGGAASSRLYWSSASTACAIVPQSRLFQ